MRIFLISNMYPSSEYPGYGVFVKNFEDGLQAQGVSFERAVIRGRGRNFFGKFYKYLVFIMSVYFGVLFKRYDLLYVHYAAHSLMPIVPLLLFKRINFVVNAHGEDLLPKSRFEKFVFNFNFNAMRKARFIVVPSIFFKEIASKHWGGGRVVVSPSGGVDIDLFSPAPKSIIASGKKFITLGYVSRIDDGKGWDVLLKAISLVKGISPEIELVVKIVGSGSRVYLLEQMIEELGLQGCVFYYGSCNHKDLPDFYRQLDVFIFPTQLPESLGLVGLEAMACGVPAICSNIGGIKTYMIDGFNGLLFPVGDCVGLSRSIITFMEMTMDSRAAMGRAARASAETYDSRRVSKSLYLKLQGIV